MKSEEVKKQGRKIKGKRGKIVPLHTKCKRAEERPKQTVEKWESTFNAITDLVSIQDKDFKFVRVNKAFGDAFNMSPEEIIGKTCYELVHGTKEPPPACPHKQTLDTKKSHTAEFFEPHLGIHLEVSTSPIFDENGGIIGSVHIAKDITERKKAEQKIKLFSDAVAGAIDGIAIVDMKGNITYANSAMEEMYGYGKGELLGKPVGVLGSDPERAPQVISTLMKTGNWGGEVLQQKKNKETFPALLSLSTIRDEKGNPIAMMGAVRDITERKKAEEELEAGKKKLETYIESMVDGVAVADFQNRLIQANKALAELLGYDSVNEMLGMDTADLVPKREISRIMEAGKECIKKGTLRNFETIALRKDGWEVPVQLNATAMKDPSGKLVGNMSVIRDITERKQAEEALRESEEKYRSFVQNFKGIAHRGDMYFRPMFFHGNVEEITGYPEDEFVSGKKRWDEMIYPEDFTDIIEKEVNNIRTIPDYVCEMDYRIVRKDGQIRWVHEVVQNTCDDGGKPIYVQGVVYDITERKKAEERLLEYQEQLKSLALQLTLAEESERHRIATELHTTISQSLVVSKLQLDTLRASAPSADIAKTLGEVCGSLDETIQGTRSLMFDLSSPILYELGFEKAVAEWLTKRIQQKHSIATEFVDDRQPKPLDEDVRVFLFRDVRELLINIVRHAKANKVKVSIRRVGRQMQVSVEDDGRGFDPKKVAAMAVKKGGFGLFSIRERLEQLGGKLRIESAPGEGTKATLVAPLKEEKVDDGQ